MREELAQYSSPSLTCRQLQSLDEDCFYNNKNVTTFWMQDTNTPVLHDPRPSQT